MVWDKGFLGVVADKEWDAIKAAQQLKVEWSDAKPPFPDRPRSTTTSARPRCASARSTAKQTGNVDDAFKTAARVIEAEYEWPFQSHACMGPACAVVEIKDGNVTCWTGSQKPHFVQNGIALSLGIPVEKVRSIWVVGPGSYGRSDADDAAMDAAILANAVGKPVRVQYTRDQATGWDPKGPASIHRARAAIDAAGNVIAYEFNSKGFSRIDVNTNGGDAAGIRLPGTSAMSSSNPATVSACRRNPTSSPTSAWRGRRSRRCSTAPRRCAARICAIRSDRRSTSPASRSWTRWRRRSTSIRSSSACATSRIRATSR